VDALTRAAITGTSREAPPASGLPTDGLLEGAKRSPERDLLLRAGMHAVYRTAGRKAEVGARAPGPAPEETLPSCSAKGDGILHQLLTGRREEILREALERLRLAGLRLPHALLPAALDVQHPDLRPAVAAVLGERGRWLAGLGPAWGWAVADGGSEHDDETVWEEGALEARLAALRSVRGRDAEEGLRLVEEVWKSEKADTRVEMVSALESGLSPGDEPFLERVLDDRSVRVREAAVALLARLPGSAYTERAMARADAVLASYEPPASGPLRRRRAGRIVLEPPQHLDAWWRRDLPGSDRPPHRVGEKAWRITLALSVVPPEHWERRLGATPEELVAARGEWEEALLTGWSLAARRFGDGSWALPIWQRCQQAPEKQGAGSWGEWKLAWDAALALVPSMSRSRFTRQFLRVLREDGMTDRLATTLSHLPAPWYEELGLLYVEELRKHVSETFARNRDEGDPWLWTLQHAAERIPPSCLEHASFAQPDEVLVERTFSNGQVVRYEPHHLRSWRRELTKFEETLELRRKLVEEIPL
jgi:Family of unknown function (DUF5691)